MNMPVYIYRLEPSNEQPHEDAEFRPFPIILFLLLIRHPTMKSQRNARRRLMVCVCVCVCVCAASILDKADNERAVVPLFHSPSSVSAFQQLLLDKHHVNITFRSRARRTTSDLQNDRFSLHQPMTMIVDTN